MHGFPSWPALRRHVAALRNGGGEPFARAYRAARGPRPRRARRASSTASRASCARAGRTATTSSGWRRRRATSARSACCSTAAPTPRTPTRTAGRRCTRPRTPTRPGSRRILLDAGAPAGAEARGDGGTPLVAALFWGHRATAELLAERGGLHPRNLRVAAGLGRDDVVDELVRPDGTLSPEAGAHRGFYRPHSGFPAWRPGGSPQEALDEALAWAARSDRVDTLDVLVARGARVDADVYRGTALAWAAACGRVAAVERLIALGADPCGRGTFGGPDHGDGDHRAPPRRPERRRRGHPRAARGRRRPDGRRGRALRRHARRLGGATSATTPRPDSCARDDATGPRPGART